MPGYHHSQIIAVIGATGAQGMPVVEALLAPSADGTPSPWRVKILTRDPEHRRAVRLQKLGAEIVQGSFMDLPTVSELFKDAYGAFVNTDGFSVGQTLELQFGVMIYELAVRAKVTHYVWSSLDYGLKKGNFDPIYSCDHYDSKGRVADYLKSQPIDRSGTSWSILTSGPYMDMLNHLFAPLKQNADGAFIFGAPIGTGHVPMIALEDLGFFARYVYEHPDETVGQDLEVASQLVSWPELVETFTRVTGLPAEYKSMNMDEYFDLFNGADEPVANELKSGTTYRQNFSGWWSLWRDDIIHRDMDLCSQQCLVSNPPPVRPGATLRSTRLHTTRTTAYQNSHLSILHAPYPSRAPSPN